MKSDINMRKILLLLFPMLLMADVLSKDDYKYAIQYFYKSCYNTIDGLSQLRY